MSLDFCTFISFIFKTLKCALARLFKIVVLKVLKASFLHWKFYHLASVLLYYMTFDTELNATLSGIWYHFYNLKHVKNIHGGVLLLEKFKPATLQKVALLHECFFTLFKLYKWYQIVQSIAMLNTSVIVSVPFEFSFNGSLNISKTTLTILTIFYSS